MSESDSDVGYLPCKFKLYEYVADQNLRPQSNDITFWKNFVKDYYDSGAIERWCYASYNDKGVSVGPKIPEEYSITNQCEICGLTSNRHLELKAEKLPEIFRFQFRDTFIREELDLGESEVITKKPNGNIMLEYEKAVGKMSYKSFAIIHEGKLRVHFTEDVKILSWEFCARSRTVQPKVVTGSTSELERTPILQK